MKRKNHAVTYSEEISEDNIVIVPEFDTSISSLLYKNVPDFQPYYTGNIPDYSRKSLMDIKILQTENAMQITERQTRIKDFEAFEKSLAEQNNLNNDKNL